MRAATLTATLEDYLEAIFNIVRRHSVKIVIDLRNFLRLVRRRRRLAKRRRV